MAKRVLFAILGLVLLLAAAVAVNTLRQGSRQLVVPPAPPLAIDEKAVADKLAGAIRFRTVSSREDAEANKDQFLKLHAYLQQCFPRLHGSLQREVVGGLSLLYTWKGADANAKPVALLAHHDVVPVEPGTDARWQAAPFDGTVQDGYVWGRGAWDDKGNLIAQMEAIEMLLASGFQPRQTVYLVSGADEEVSSLRGAAEIARLLAQRKVRLDFVMQHVKSKTGERFELFALPGAGEPTPITPTSSSSYKLLERTVRSLFPDTVVTPGLYVAASDSRMFVDIADHIYRFSPVRVAREDLPRLHGTNERIATANLAELVRFYHQLLRNLNAPPS